VSQRVPLDPKLVEAAGLTPRQREAVEWYDGQNQGYRFVARQLDVTFESARGTVRTALFKLERAMRAPAPEPSLAPREKSRPSVKADEPGASIKVFDFE
jgi:hypothetical protein